VPEAEVTARIAEFVTGTPFDSLPSSLVNTARRMLVDVVGVSLAGAANGDFDCVHQFGARYAGAGAVPGPRGRTYDVSWSALLIGAAAHMLDYDDVQTAMGGHPSVTLLPVVSALGYAEGASGREVLRAMVLATEIDTRLGRGMNPSHYVLGWHPTSVIGSIGAAVAASVLLGLDELRTRRAIGIAASYAGGTKANFGSNVKSLHAGMTGRAGVEAGLLASLGATANDRILDRQFGGFLDLFAPDTDLSATMEELGSVYQMERAGVSFKLLPCCGSTHSATWAAIALHEQYHIPAERIREIRVHLDPRRIAHTDRSDVRTGLQGKFSAQYCQAVGAIQGRLSLRDFEDEVVREPVRQAVVRRVRLIPTEDLSDRGPVETSSTGSRSTYVEIEDTDGKVYGHFQPAPRGYASIPPSDADITAKFIDCLAVAGRTSESAHSLHAGLDEIEKSDDVRPLMADVWNS
jgi:2-methylcitrate dehydratase PrpD